MKPTLRVALAALAVSGCAYFNTFYNARQAFERAERIRERAAPGDTAWRASARAQYENAIQKASRVLTFYSESGYADDAVMLIGLSYYHLGDYVKAERKFRELVVNFPQSKFAAQAYLRLAECDVLLSREREAVEALSVVLSRGDGELHDDARLMLARITADVGEPPAAVKAYEDFLSRHPGSEFAPVARYELARIQERAGDFARARETYASVGAARGDRDVEFRARLGAARCLYSLGRAEESARELDAILAREEFFQWSGPAMVWRGRALLAAGKVDDAVRAFEDAAEQHSTDASGAEALIALGDLHRDVLGDLEGASDAYARAARVSGVPDSLSQRARAEAAEIARVISLQTALADTAQAEQVAANRYRLAEVYRDEFAWPDSAREEFLSIAADLPQSPLAPRALMSAAALLEESGDSSSALDLCRRVVAEYASSDEAADAWRKLPEVGRPDREDPGVLYDSALTHYALGGFAEAVRCCDSLASIHPQSRFAPMAMFLAAKSAERLPGDTTSHARYLALAQQMPSTEEGKAALVALGRASEVIARGAEVSSDSMLVFAMDSVGRSGTGSTFPDAPPVLEFGQLELPDLEGLRISHVLVLKIILDTFGHVTAAEVIGSSNDRDVDDAVLDAVLASTFNVRGKSPEELSTWFQLRVNIDEFGKKKEEGRS